MKLIVLFVICSFVKANYAGQHPNNLFRSKRVVSGQDIKIDDAPWQVSIHYESRFKCSGSIINERWVITSASCVSQATELYHIRAGSSWHHAGGTLYFVNKIIKHEHFQSNEYEFFMNDIALIQINSSFTFDSTCKKIDLPSVDDEPIHSLTQITVSGWGDIVMYANSLQQYSSYGMMQKSQCNETLAKYGGISDGQICFESSSFGSACRKDAGGPVRTGSIYDAKLIGIISWSEGCGCRDLPMVVTEISAHRFWIKRHSGV